MQFSSPPLSLYQSSSTLIAFLIQRHSIIPNSIHTKPGLLNITMRHACQKLPLPPINLQPAVLIIRKRNPLVAPVARADGVGVAPGCGRRVEADLALDVAGGAESEGGDVAREVVCVGAGGGVEVFFGGGESADVGAVHGFGVGDSC